MAGYREVVSRTQTNPNPFSHVFLELGYREEPHLRLCKNRSASTTLGGPHGLPKIQGSRSKVFGMYGLLKGSVRAISGYATDVIMGYELNSWPWLKK